jgi:hypothetical protein
MLLLVYAHIVGGKSLQFLARVFSAPFSYHLSSAAANLCVVILREVWWHKVVQQLQCCMPVAMGNYVRCWCKEDVFVLYN